MKENTRTPVQDHHYQPNLTHNLKILVSNILSNSHCNLLKSSTSPVVVITINLHTVPSYSIKSCYPIVASVSPEETPNPKYTQWASDTLRSESQSRQDSAESKT